VALVRIQLSYVVILDGHAQENFEGFVVQEASARLDADDFYTVDVDHFQVCQPESRISSSFQHLREFVSDELQKVFTKSHPSDTVLHRFV
jgi:hypothetical protein